MASFDMHGQNVTNQYNAARDMNFGAVKTPEDLVTVLDQLNGQLTSAKNDGTLDEETALDAQYQLAKAMQQARYPTPEKEAIMKYLLAAKIMLMNVAAASGLVKSVVDVVSVVEKLFS